MVLSRILGDSMILLFSLRFLVNKASGVKATGHFNKFSVVSCSFLGFHRRIISIFQIIRACVYLYWNCLLRQFIIVSYRSIPLIRIGGELNDFNQ